jgi:hypothetical protein
VKMIEVQETALHARHDAREPALAFKQRQRAKIFAFEHQQIECIEVRPLTSKEKIPEVAAAIRIEAADFAVENGAPCTDRMCNFFRELRPRFERVTTARDQLAAMTAHICERTKPVNLRFEDEISMIEWLRNSEEPHWRVLPHASQSVSRRVCARGARRLPAQGRCVNRASTACASSSARLASQFRIAE